MKNNKYFALISVLTLLSVFCFYLTQTQIIQASGATGTWESETPTSDNITFNNPLAFNSVQGVLGSLLNTLQGIIVTISLVFIVIGAVFYITSTGNEKRMNTAKGAIFAALIGLAIGIAAPSFLKEIYTILGGTPTVDCAGLIGEDLTKCNAANATLTSGKSLTAIAMSTLEFLLSIAGIIALIMIVIGGITYFTSAGDEKKSETGKKMVKFAAIGVAITMGSLVIVRQIATLIAS